MNTMLMKCLAAAVWGQLLYGSNSWAGRPLKSSLKREISLGIVQILEIEMDVALVGSYHLLCDHSAGGLQSCSQTKLEPA